VLPLPETCSIQSLVDHILTADPNLQRLVVLMNGLDFTSTSWVKPVRISHLELVQSMFDGATPCTHCTKYHPVFGGLEAMKTGNIKVLTLEGESLWLCANVAEMLVLTEFSREDLIKRIAYQQSANRWQIIE
jgi:hypothetical protein